MSLREVGRFVGLSNTAVMRHERKALAKIGRALGVVAGRSES